MITLNILKKKHLNNSSVSFDFSRSFSFNCCYKNKQKSKPINLKVNFGNAPFCTYHTNVQYKKNLELYPKKMDCFFKKKNKSLSSTNVPCTSDQSLPSTLRPFEGTNFFSKPLFFSSFKNQNYNICFHEIIISDTISRKKIKSNMQIPGLKKITCSYTQKMLVSSSTDLFMPMCALTFLTAQNCTIVWAKKSVSSWKLRKNSVIGCKVTLRRKAALVFLDKFYIYGREGLFTKKKNFLNNFPFYFGVSKNTNFIELQKLSTLSSNFSGFSVTLH